MNRNTSGCWTCRIRKKGDCSGPGTAGDCSKCIELNIECLRGYGERLLPEWRNRYIVDEISKWTRNKNSRWSPTRLSLYGLLEKSQRRLAALASEPHAPPLGASPSIQSATSSSTLDMGAFEYGSASSSPEVSQHSAAQMPPTMVRNFPLAGNVPASGPVFPGSAPLAKHMYSGTNVPYAGGYPPSLDPSFSGPQGRDNTEFAPLGTDIREMSRGMISTSSMRGEANAFSTSASVQPEWQSGNAILNDVSGTYLQAAGGHQFVQGGSQWRNAFHANPSMTENPGYYRRVEDMAAQHGDTSAGAFLSPDERTVQDTGDRRMMMGTRDIAGAPMAHDAWPWPQEHEDTLNNIGDAF